MDAITKRCGRRVEAVKLDCEISAPCTSTSPTPTKFQVEAVVDTGCTDTTFNKSFLDSIGLFPIGSPSVSQTGNGSALSYPYLINLYLPNNISFLDLNVNALVNLPVDMLLGMDILTQGDMSITNFNGETVFNFQIPATHAYNYEEDARFAKIHALQSRTGINKCPCGSQKNYDNCHGRNLKR